MRVLVTADTGERAERIGVQQYTFELVRALAASHPDIEVSILVHDVSRRSGARPAGWV